MRYNILVEKFKFKVVADCYIRRYNDVNYQFYYFEGMLRLTLDRVCIYEFYDDLELFDYLAKTFPKEARKEKLKLII